MKFMLSPLAVAILAAPAAAQIDYRNLDQGRPTAVEDAYSLERYGFELSGEYRRIGMSSDGVHLLVPEVMFGFAKGAHAAIRLPFLIPSEPSAGPRGLAGADVSVLLNLSTERTSLPALAVRLDASLPAGVAAGHGTGVAVTGIATRSFGSQRVHLNASLALASPDVPARADQWPRWWVGLAVDQTLLRSSTLLVGEASVASDSRDAPLTYRAGIGIRRQVAPTVVADLGLGLIYEPTRTETVISLGFSHSFALAFLMPGDRR